MPINNLIVKSLIGHGSFIFPYHLRNCPSQLTQVILHVVELDLSLSIILTLEKCIAVST